MDVLNRARDSRYPNIQHRPAENTSGFRIIEEGYMKICPNCNAECAPEVTECPQCGTDFTYLAEKRAKKAAEAAKWQARREKIISRVNTLMFEMSEDQLIALLSQANEIHTQKNRKHPRIPCLIPTDYVTRQQAYQDYITNISIDGVFIETEQSFEKGEGISLTLALSPHVKPFKVTGTIVQSVENGIGVEFTPTSQIQKDLIRHLVKTIKELRE